MAMLPAKNANWITCALALTILAVRLATSHWSPYTSRLSISLCILSIIVIVIRLPLIYYALRYGTAADALELDSIAGLDPHEIKVGSILTLIMRFLATTFYWTQTALLLIFYTHVLSHINWCRKAIKGIWAVLILTFLACLLSLFLDCRPFDLYWRLDPMPNRCSRAYGQIFTQGILNVVLDVMLLVVSFPLWTGRNFTTLETIKVSTLLLLGTFCTIVTGLKLAYVVGANSGQAARSFWASVQILVSAFVANVPTIYGSIRLWTRRRQQLESRKNSVTLSLIASNNTHPRVSDDEMSTNDLERGQSHLNTATIYVIHQEYAEQFPEWPLQCTEHAK